MSWWKNLFGNDPPPPPPTSPPPWLLPFLDSRTGQAIIKTDVQVIVVSFAKARVIFIKKSLADSARRGLIRRGCTDPELAVLTVALAAALQATCIEQSDVQRYMTSTTRYVADLQGVPQWIFGDSPIPKTWRNGCHAVLLPGHDADLSHPLRSRLPTESFEVLDFRSHEEKRLEQDALAGNVDSNLELLVDELLACSQHISDTRQRHIQLARIGETLNQSGGFSRMRLAAYRFAARGGAVTDLSLAWHGIGEWQH